MTGRAGGGTLAGMLETSPLPHTSADAPPLVDELTFGSIAAQLVYAAAELGIADRLADGPRTGAELAARLGVEAPPLRRLLRALAGLGVLDDTGDDGFALTADGALLRADAAGSHRSLVRMLCGPEMWRALGALVPSLATGERAWELANGLPVFVYYDDHPDAGATFNAAMAEHTRDAAPGIAAAGGFTRFRTVVDVGGGDGMLLAQILRDHPRLEGVVLDVPEVVAGAHDTLAAEKVADRCRVVPGDFFASVPAGADAYVLKQVLHDWEDEPAVAILRRCREAMEPGGRVLIAERLLPQRVGRAERLTLFVDVLMLAVTGGRERTEAEFRALLEAADLELAAVSPPLPLGYRVLEARASR